MTAIDSRCYCLVQLDKARGTLKNAIAVKSATMYAGVACFFWYANPTQEPEKGSGLVVTERTVLHKTKKDLKSAGVIENLTTEVAENKFAAKDERF